MECLCCRYVGKIVAFDNIYDYGQHLREQHHLLLLETLPEDIPPEAFDIAQLSEYMLSTYHSNELVIEIEAGAYQCRVHTIPSDYEAAILGFTGKQPHGRCGVIDRPLEKYELQSRAALVRAAGVIDYRSYIKLQRADHHKYEGELFPAVYPKWTQFRNEMIKELEESGCFRLRKYNIQVYDMGYKEINLVTREWNINRLLIDFDVLW